MADDDPEMDTVWTFPPTADLSVFDDPDAVIALAQSAFGAAAKAAIAENDRLGIPSWSRDDDDLVAHLRGKEVERRRWKKTAETT